MNITNNSKTLKQKEVYLSVHLQNICRVVNLLHNIYKKLLLIIDYCAVWESVPVQEDHVSELNTYTKCINWLEASRKDFSNWYTSNVSSPESSVVRRVSYTKLWRII